MRCSDVTWEMRHGGDSLDELARANDKAAVEEGTLVWQPKGGEGHVVTGVVEKREYGWTTVEFPVCECGDLDFEDHHWVVLAAPDRSGY